MCTTAELAKKVDSLAENVDELNESLPSLRKDTELFKSNLALMNSVIDELKDFKSASIVKKMEEDIAVLNIMKELQQDVRNMNTKVAQLTNEMTTRPCYVNPGMYSKFMKELSNEIIDTKGRIFLMLDKSGKVKMINHYGCQLIGSPATEIVGKKWIDYFIPEEDRERIDLVLKSLLDGSMNGYDTVINSIVTNTGRVEIRWKNYIFSDEKELAVAILSLGEKL